MIWGLEFGRVLSRSPAKAHAFRKNSRIAGHRASGDRRSRDVRIGPRHGLERGPYGRSVRPLEQAGACKDAAPQMWYLTGIPEVVVMIEPKLEVPAELRDLAE